MLRRLAAIVLFSAACNLSAEEIKADPATPKGAAVAMFKAMEAGDVAAAKKLATGNEKQLGLLDSMVPLMNGFKTLEISAVKKFGDDGKKILQGDAGGPGPSLDIEKELTGAKEEIAGETATITPTGADSSKQPMKFKKVDGSWKIDLASMPTEGLDNPAAMTMVKAMGGLARDTAKEIDDNKYKTVEEAKTAMQQKMLPIILQAAAANQGGAAVPPPPVVETPKDPKDQK